MKKTNIKKNYIYNLLYQIIALILPIIITPYVSRVLGANNIGIYSYTISITTYFITFGSLGIALYGQREIAYVQGDPIKYSKLFWEVILCRFISTFMSLVLFYSIFVFRTNLYQKYFFILTFEIISSIFDISWFFMGLEEFKKTIARNLIIKVLSVIAIFVFVKSGNDIKNYFYIYVFSMLAGNLSLWLYLPKYLRKIALKNLSLKKHIKPTLSLFIPQIAVQIYTLLDKTMIGVIISDKSEVGYYEQSQKIVKMLLTIVTSLGTVMMPRIANNFALGKKEKIREYMSKSFNLVFAISFPLIFGLIAVSDCFVPIFFGNGYDKVALLMKIITPIILLIGLSNVTGTQYLLPTKRQKEYTTSVVIGACVNFIFNIALIPKYGAIGASVGTVIAELTVTFIQAYFVRNDFKFSAIFNMSLKYLFSSIIMFIVCYLISVIVESNLVSILLQVSCGGITYVLILIILKDKFLLSIINRIIKKFKIKK